MILILAPIIFIIAAVIGIYILFCISTNSEHNSYSGTSTPWTHLLSPAHLKGTVGENAVSRRLHSLSEKHYVTLDDIIIPNFNTTAQIDHIVISTYGIFVIETKNYSGKIYGSQQAKEWTQYLHGNKYTLYNPVQQNRTHIMALSRLINSAHIPNLPVETLYHSIIAFPENRNVHADNVSVPIVSYYELTRTIAQYTVPLLTPDQITQILDTILQHRLITPDALSTHIQNHLP